MGNRSGLRVLVLYMVVLSFVFAGAACEKSKDVSGKPKTSIDKPLAPGAFKAEITAIDPPVAVKANSYITARVKVKNISPVLWPSKGLSNGNFSINLSYHWLDSNNTPVIFDGGRTPLPYDIGPNDEIVLNTGIQAPDKPGDYILEFDMVQEGVGWFKERGSKTQKITVKVE